MTTLYHTARITKNGDWSVKDYSKPTSDDCVRDLPDGTVTDHEAMGAVQQPAGWTLVGVIESDDDRFPATYGVFAIDFPNVGPLYLVEIRGSNAVPALIGKGPLAIRVHTSGRTEWCAATVYARVGQCAPYWTDKGVELHRVALFTSPRAAEMAVADGELRNGQIYRVRAARGEPLREGVVIDSYQAPCRPRQDPTAARVIKSYRVHPDTARLIEAEAKRTGESQGVVLDRLGKGLHQHVNKGGK